MALQLAMTDKFGNSYPKGYRRLEFFAIAVTDQTIIATFNDYPSKAIRDSDIHNYFRQTKYLIRKDAQPEVRDSQGNVIQIAQPAFADFMAADNANTAGFGTTIYNFVKQQADNANATDV